MYLVNFPQVSNSADWVETLELTSEDDGTPIDLTGCTITLQVWQQTTRGPGSVYAGAYYGIPSNSSPVLEATTANGKITVPAPGVIQWAFRVTELNALAAGFYEVGMTIAKSPDTSQLLLGVVPIVNGVVQ